MYAESDLIYRIRMKVRRWINQLPKMQSRPDEKEQAMSEHTLHLMSPTRHDNIAAIVGDRLALEELRKAVDMALGSGSGGAFLFGSDGEGFSLAVVLEKDMHSVYTSYAQELCPSRSLRELVPLRAVRNFSCALEKALSEAKVAAQPTSGAIPFPAGKDANGLASLSSCSGLPADAERSNEQCNYVAN
jgi:hypothetical protein